MYSEREFIAHNMTWRGWQEYICGVRVNSRKKKWAVDASTLLCCIPTLPLYSTSLNIEYSGCGANTTVHFRIQRREELELEDKLSYSHPTEKNIASTSLHTLYFFAKVFHFYLQHHEMRWDGWKKTFSLEQLGLWTQHEENEENMYGEWESENVRTK
jgi:hypothetical protein